MRAPSAAGAIRCNRNQSLAPIHSGMLEVAIDQAILFRRHPEAIGHEVATDARASPSNGGQLVSFIEGNGKSSIVERAGPLEVAEGGLWSRLLLGVAAFFAHPAVRQFFRSVAAVVARTATQEAMRRMGVRPTNRLVQSLDAPLVTSKPNGAEVIPTANTTADINPAFVANSEEPRAEDFALAVKYITPAGSRLSKTWKQYAAPWRRPSMRPRSRPVNGSIGSMCQLKRPSKQKNN